MRFRLLLFLILIFAMQSQATTISVPSQQPTIQAGINAATGGDTVLVAPGTYTGTGNRDLTFNGTNIVLLSEQGADVTIIDCQADVNDQHVGIFLDNGEDSTSVIDGFTITNAHFYATFPEYGDGAIYFRDGLANVQNCNIINNGVTGIFLDYFTTLTPSRISNCLISGNNFGVYNMKVGTVIENSILKNNLYSGIGFYSYTEIKSCLIVHNGWAGISQSSGMGGYVNLVENCTIAFNRIGIEYDRTLPRTNEMNAQLDTTLITNTIVAYNSIGGIFNFFDLEQEYNCTYSNVYGNIEYNWQNDKYAGDDVFGNLSVDPLFCDTLSNNFNLTENSLCASINNNSGSTIGVYDVGCECCVGMRGNVDGDPDEIIDISDLVAMVQYMFYDGWWGFCIEEMDVDGTGGISPVDISDLVYMVDFMFSGGLPPVSCNN